MRRAPKEKTKTNNSTGMAATLPAVPFSRAHSQPTARRTQTKPNKPTTRDHRPASQLDLRQNANAGNRPAGMLPLNRLRSSQLPFGMAHTDMLWWMDNALRSASIFFFSLWVRLWRLVTISGTARGKQPMIPHKLIPRLSFVFGFFLLLFSFWTGLG